MSLKCPPRLRLVIRSDTYSSHFRWLSRINLTEFVGWRLLWLWEISCLRFIHIDLRFKIAPKEGLKVKSHDLGDQFTSPLREITMPSNRSCRMSIVACGVWHVEPSCWNHMLSVSISSILGHKKLLHRSVAFAIDGYGNARFVLKEVRWFRQTKIRTKQWLSRDAFGADVFRVDWYRPKFCLFTYPFIQKWASSLKMICLAKCAERFSNGALILIIKFYDLHTLLNTMTFHGDLPY